MKSVLEQRGLIEGLDCQAKKCPCWPLRARWLWLDSECNLREKVIEWKFPFDFESHVEEFFNASLTGDFSKLPIPQLKSESYFSLTDTLEESLRLTRAELNQVKSICIEDFPNGWKFVIDGHDISYRMKWMVGDLKHVKKL